MTTTFLLIRHAAHARVDDTLVGRTPGVGLSERGRAQAAALAARLPGRNLAAVYSSPLQRARETAAPIAAAAGVVARESEGVAEIDFGDWTGRGFAALDGDPAWTRWNENRGSARPPNGESMAEARDRALRWLNEARLLHGTETVAVVSHCDVIRAVLLGVLGLALDSFHRIEVSPASVSRILLWDGGGRVLSLNEPPDDLGA